jgi:hypothetical protein
LTGVHLQVQYEILSGLRNEREIASSAKSMAFTSPRLVPGSGGGNFQNRTQLEKVLIETLQQPAA